MFAAVMSDAEQCRHLLELVLEMKILEVNVVAEKTISYHPEYHGVRLDVMAEEAGTKRRFNVEMQVKTETALAKRSRYYHYGYSDAQCRWPGGSKICAGAHAKMLSSDRNWI